MYKLANVYREFFPVGTAVSNDYISKNRLLLLRHFNSLTAENCMKPVYVHPFEDKYDFGRGSQVADFAIRNRMLLRGHCLVWHKQTPDWFFLDGDSPAGRNKVLSRMESHIQTVVGCFRAAAYAWDVVNEAVSDVDGEAPLRAGKWLSLGGEDYIPRAFRAAKQVDPQCRLFYNDFNETRPAKSRRIYDLVKGLLSDGVPVDGLGMQGHYNIYGPSADEVSAAIELYASLGVELQITELDVSLFRHGDQTSFDEPPAELLEMQAERYGELFAVFRKYSKYITGVTLWGASDEMSWLNNFPVKNRQNWPLLFDCEHRPKAAFERAVQWK